MNTHPDQISLRRYLDPIRRFAPLVVIGALVGAGVGFGAHTLTETTYTSSVSVLVSPISDDPVDGLGTSGVEVDMATEAEVATSLLVAERANELLAGAPPAKDPRDLLDQLDTSVRGTRIIVISFTAVEPEIARRGAEAFAEAFIAYRDELATAQLEVSSGRLAERIEQLQLELTDVSTRRAAVPEEERDGAAYTALVISEQTLLDELSVNQGRLADLRAVVTDDAVVLDRASLPRTPSSLGLTTLVVGGAAAGLVLGAGLALMLDAARHRHDDDEFVEWAAARRRLDATASGPNDPPAPATAPTTVATPPVAAVADSEPAPEAADPWEAPGPPVPPAATPPATDPWEAPGPPVPPAATPPATDPWEAPGPPVPPAATPPATEPWQTTGPTTLPATEPWLSSTSPPDAPPPWPFDRSDTTPSATRDPVVAGADPGIVAMPDPFAVGADDDLANRSRSVVAAWSARGGDDRPGHVGPDDLWAAPSSLSDDDAWAGIVESATGVPADGPADRGAAFSSPRGSSPVEAAPWMTPSAHGDTEPSAGVRREGPAATPIDLDALLHERAGAAVAQLGHHLTDAVDIERRTIVVVDGGDGAAGPVAVAMAVDLAANGRRTQLVDPEGTVLAGVAPGRRAVHHHPNLEVLIGEGAGDRIASAADAAGADAVVVYAGAAVGSPLVAGGGNRPGAIVIATTGTANPAAIDPGAFELVLRSPLPLIGIVSIAASPVLAPPNR